MRTLVVVPTYNEAANAVPLAREILARAPGVEVLFVDDASPDGTADRVAREGERERRVGLLRRPAKLGIGSAYLAGFRHALEGGFDRVVTMDCDHSHHPRYLPALLAAMDGHELAIGSRYVAGGGIAHWPLHRRALSAFANLYTRVLLRLPVRDCTSGYRCHSRELIERVDPFGVRASGYAFLEEMVYRVHRHGLRIAEVPIVFEDRHAGASKIGQAEIYRAAWHVLRTALRPPPVAARAARPADKR